MMHDWWGPGGWGGMGFGPLIWLVLLALAIVGIIALLRQRGDSNGAAGNNSRTPLQILDERFAKGEIDKDEYEERRRLLKG